MFPNYWASERARATALQFQRDALAHGAQSTRYLSSMEIYMEILEAHLLVPCHLNDENVNKYAVNNQKLMFQNKIGNI